MDKFTPKPADAFQANRDRAAPLLEKLKAEGIGHIIDGKIVPSISGDTFETKSDCRRANASSLLMPRYAIVSPPASTRARSS